MQFDPEETGEARRQRQRNYHAFLDAQVQARRKSRLLEVPATDINGVEAARFPSLPLSGRLKHEANPPPYGVDPAVVGTGRRGTDVGRMSRSLDDGSGAESRDRIGIASDREECLNRLENRLEGEVQRRHLVERKVAVLGQKVMADASQSSPTQYEYIQDGIQQALIYCITVQLYSSIAYSVLEVDVPVFEQSLLVPFCELNSSFSHRSSVLG